MNEPVVRLTAVSLDAGAFERPVPADFCYSCGEAPCGIDCPNDIWEVLPQSFARVGGNHVYGQVLDLDHGYAHDLPDPAYLQFLHGLTVQANTARIIALRRLHTQGYSWEQLGSMLHMDPEAAREAAWPKDPP